MPENRSARFGVARQVAYATLERFRAKGINPEPSMSTQNLRGTWPVSPRRVSAKTGADHHRGYRPGDPEVLRDALRNVAGRGEA
jgi:hypothetical protein